MTGELKPEPDNSHKPVCSENARSSSPTRAFFGSKRTISTSTSADVAGLRIAPTEIVEKMSAPLLPSIVTPNLCCEFNCTDSSDARELTSSITPRIAPYD